MGLGDKMKHAAEDLAGKAKETAGKVTDNEQLEAEGKADQVDASIKKAGDRVEDTVEDAKDSFK